MKEPPLTPRDQDDAQFAALAALPWRRTADEQPKWAIHSTARFLVLTGPFVGAGGCLAAELAIAHYHETGWVWAGHIDFGRQTPIDGDVVAWLDTSRWDCERLAEQLTEPPT